MFGLTEEGDVRLPRSVFLRVLGARHYRLLLDPSRTSSCNQVELPSKHIMAV